MVNVDKIHPTEFISNQLLTIIILIKFKKHAKLNQYDNIEPKKIVSI